MHICLSAGGPSSWVWFIPENDSDSELVFNNKKRIPAILILKGLVLFLQLGLNKWRGLFFGLLASFFPSSMFQLIKEPHTSFTKAGYLIYWNFVSQTVFGERDCFQPIKLQEIRKQSLCSGNSKIVSLLTERISLSKETFFEFPAIWLVEKVLFLWDFFKCIKSQNLKSLGTDLLLKWSNPLCIAERQPF